MGMKFSVDGGGGGSSAFSAVPADIAATARAITGDSETIGAGRTYGAVDGVGDYQNVASAVAARVSVWNPALDAWQSSLTSLGEALAGVGSAIEATDANLAQAWSSASLSTQGQP